LLEMRAAGYFEVKRLMDFLFSACSLVVLLPLFALIAVVLFLDSPGPVFYRQERVTQKGKPFQIWKFRSMVPGARDLQFSRGIQAEALVTRFGRLLRRTHFDEFPQLINVLLGDMSLVGPRPLMTKWVGERAQANPMALQRFKVKAGMAGLERLFFLLQDDAPALARFFPGLASFIGSTDLGYLDSYYVNHVSPALDLKIFALTFYMSLKRFFG